MDSEIELRESLIKERNEDISSISHDIIAIKDVFEDLAKIVHEQGEQLHSIEDNIENAVYECEEAHKHLQQAERMQSKGVYTKIMGSVLFVSGVIAIILIII